MNPESERRFRLTLHYDGSGFLGWQIQASGRTVQGEMEDALARLTGARRPVVGSGRTDRGVHATGQVAAVSLPARWEAEELRRALNATLPPDLWVSSVREVPLDFHPRYDALARSYTYRLGLAEETLSPFHRRWCWPLVRDLSVDDLQRGAGLLLGRHSFRAFAKAGQEERGEYCSVSEAGWQAWEDLGVTFSITADRFLHRMVRYLVGTMVAIARGRRSLEELEELLDDPDTSLETSPPAPAEGLFLVRVHYPGDDYGLD